MDTQKNNSSKQGQSTQQTTETISKSQNDGKKKVSKAVVTVFIFSILSIIGFLFTWFSYESFTVLILGLVFSLAVLYLFYYLRKRAIKNNLGGAKMATFAVCAFGVIIILDLIGALALIGYSNKLNVFADTVTPTFFENDLLVLKENSTSRLNKLISYEKEIEDVKKELEEIGKIKECVKEKNDINMVMYGPDDDMDNFNIVLAGVYSRRCYGENKSFDILVNVEYEDGKWFVDDYNIRSDIGKTLFDKEDEDDK